MCMTAHMRSNPSATTSRAWPELRTSSSGDKGVRLSIFFSCRVTSASLAMAAVARTQDVLCGERVHRCRLERADQRAHRDRREEKLQIAATGVEVLVSTDSDHFTRAVPSCRCSWLGLAYPMGWRVCRSGPLQRA